MAKKVLGIIVGFVILIAGAVVAVKLFGAALDPNAVVAGKSQDVKIILLPLAIFALANIVALVAASAIGASGKGCKIAVVLLAAAIELFVASVWISHEANSMIDNLGYKAGMGTIAGLVVGCVVGLLVTKKMGKKS